jgi:small-conductance mechanosensitive channel
MKRSNWNTLLGEMRLGCSFIGATFNKDLEFLEEAIDQMAAQHEEDGKPYLIDRIHVGGVTSLQLKKPDGNISYLDKKGKVYSHGPFYLVHNTWDATEGTAAGMNTVIYRRDTSND